MLYKFKNWHLLSLCLSLRELCQFCLNCLKKTNTILEEVCDWCCLQIPAHDSDMEKFGCHWLFPALLVLLSCPQEECCLVLNFWGLIVLYRAWLWKPKLSHLARNDSPIFEGMRTGRMLIFARILRSHCPQYTSECNWLWQLKRCQLAFAYFDACEHAQAKTLCAACCVLFSSKRKTTIFTGLLSLWIGTLVLFQLSPVWWGSYLWFLLVWSSDSSNFVIMSNSTFKFNEAARTGLIVSQGGALSVSSQATENHCDLLLVLIDSINFKNNKAADSGGTLFTSDKCLKVNIQNSIFEVSEQIYDSPRGVFILSHSDISIKESVFSRFLKSQSSSLVELKMLSEMAHIVHLGFTVQCHSWYKLILEEKFIQNDFKEVMVGCFSCPSSFYVPSEGQFIVSYLSGQTSVFVTSSANDELHMECVPCPAGENCPGNDLTSSPNFWGFRQSNEITMHQCPAEYRCTKDCSGYNHCSGYRTGVLCGGCQEQYSLSMLSSQCLEENTCDDHWLWWLVIFVMVLYMLWYTTKEDILSFPGYIKTIVVNHFRKELKDSDAVSVDKGYFGIVTYFVQVKSVMVITMLQGTTRAVDSIFLQIESLINLILNFELTYISNDICAMEGVTTTKKTIFKFFFLVEVYLSCSLGFLLLYLLKYILKYCNQNTDKFENMRIKLMSGLLEIIKYTYSGFTSIVFYTLVCTSVAGNYVWLYDGSVQCYSEWQTVMIIFGLTYILPYPALFVVGMKLIAQNRISGKYFFAACCIPLPFLLHLTFLLVQTQHDDHQSADSTSDKTQCTIYDGLKGEFRESMEGTQYWEAVLMLRRLLIGMTMLIPDTSIQLCVCLALYITFLVHHLCRNPFEYHLSNNVETLSLSLLCGVAAVNLYKACYLYANTNPTGLQKEILQNLAFYETVCVVVLVGYIVCCEAVIPLRAWAQKLFTKPTQLLRVSPVSESQTDPQPGSAWTCQGNWVRKHLLAEEEKIQFHYGFSNIVWVTALNKEHRDIWKKILKLFEQCVFAPSQLKSSRVEIYFHELFYGVACCSLVCFLNIWGEIEFLLQKKQQQQHNSFGSQLRNCLSQPSASGGDGLWVNNGSQSLQFQTRMYSPSQAFVRGSHNPVCVVRICGSQKQSQIILPQKISSNFKFMDGVCIEHILSAGGTVKAGAGKEAINIYMFLVSRLELSSQCAILSIPWRRNKNDISVLRKFKNMLLLLFSVVVKVVFGVYTSAQLTRFVHSSPQCTHSQANILACAWNTH